MADFKYNVAICTMYKNEAKYLVEWLEYHLAIGVQHFYLYNNLSTDDHWQLLRTYISEGLVTYHEYHVDFTKCNYYPHSTPDYPYNDCVRKYKSECQWIAFIDADEFIFLHQDANLIECLSKYQQYQGLVANWLNFGSGGYYLDPNGLVIESYRLRTLTSNPENFFVKSIVNPRVCINWQNAHIPIIHGTIVRENGVSVSNLQASLAQQVSLHQVISIFHYRKSKWHHIFKKLASIIPLSYLKTPVAHILSEQHFGKTLNFYNHINSWDKYNKLPYNIATDTRMDALIPKVKAQIQARLNQTIPDSEIQLIDPSYYYQNVQTTTYVNTNINFFGQNSMSTLFHYWFIFDEADLSKVNLQSQSEIENKPDYHKFDRTTLLTFLQNIHGSTDGISMSAHLYFKLYVDYLQWVPQDFNWERYVNNYPERMAKNEFSAITHYVEHGRLQALSYK